MSTPPSYTLRCSSRRTEGRRLVTELRGAVLSAVLASLLDHKAILTTEEQARLATIGANMEMRVRDLQEFLQEWMGADQL